MNNIYQFSTLIHAYSKGIRIPEIQRSYAQGRKNLHSSEIRENFIQALHDTFIQGTQIHLDFIYGYGEEKFFIPLDGQQRLTTLFLLHRFLARSNQAYESFADLFVIDGRKSSFWYETRITSTEFCHFLVKKDIFSFNMSNGQRLPLKESIQNHPEFIDAWQYDPTVQGMLNMLETMDSIFKENPEQLSSWFDRLVNKNEAMITFYVYDLHTTNENNNTYIVPAEEMYIKMNSRGLPLTEYENFKASLLEYNFPDEKCDYEGVEQNFKQYFSTKLDNAWIDVFWKMRNNISASISSIENPDMMMMYFIRAVLHGHLLSLKCFKDQIPNINITHECDSYLSARSKRISFLGLLHQNGWKDIFEIEQYLHWHAFLKRLTKILDILAKNPDLEFWQNTGFDKYCNIWKIHQDIVKGCVQKDEFSIEEQILFYAFWSYFLLYDLNSPREQQYRYFRMISNIAHYSDTTHLSQRTNIYNDIRLLAVHAGNLWEYLVSPEAHNELHILSQSAFSTGNPGYEEFIKAILRLHPTDPHDELSWYTLLKCAEENHYFDGQIEFLLDACGVMDALATHNWESSWDAAQNQQFLSRFKQLFMVAEEIVNHNAFEMVGKDMHLLQRAMLTFDKSTFCSTSEPPVYSYWRSQAPGNPHWSLIGTDITYGWKNYLRYGDKSRQRKFFLLFMQQIVDQKGEKNVWDYLQSLIDDFADTENQCYGFIHFETILDELRGAKQMVLIDPTEAKMPVIRLIPQTNWDSLTENKWEYHTYWLYSLLLEKGYEPVKFGRPDNGELPFEEGYHFNLPGYSSIFFNMHGQFELHSSAGNNRKVETPAEALAEICQQINQTGE